MLTNGTVLGSRWQIGKFIGEGACAKVYSVTDTKTPLDYEVVAKVIPLPRTTGKKDKEQERICNTLNYEYTLYTGLLMEFPFCCRRPMKFYGEDQGVRYLVMERLETDLVGFSSTNTITPSLLAEFGLQILDGLQWIHKKNFVFVDVKPENFMMKNNRVLFVDFGLVERYVAQAAINARAPGTRSAFAGTPTFCSLSVHKGGIPTGADDVEALGYVLLSLFSGGKMPWSTAKSDQECIRSKETCDIMHLATERNCPELGQLILNCRKLTSGQPVDYDGCRTLFNQLKNRKAAAVLSSLSSPSKRSSPRKTSRAVKTPIETMVIDEEEEVEVVVAPAPKKGRTAATPSVASKPTASIKRVLDEVVVDLNKVEGRLSEGPFTSQRETKKRATSPIKSRRTESPAKSPVRSSNRHEKAEEAPFSAVKASKDKASAVNHVEAPSGKFWQFEVSSGAYTGEKFEIGPSDDKKAKVLLKNVGRGEYCGVSLEDDEYLSECHLTAKISKQVLYIQDNGSTNGTKLNDDKLLPKKWVEVQPGAIVKIGNSELIVRNA